MKTCFIKLIGIGLLAMWMTPNLAQAEPGEAAAVRSFVQHFYDWYVPLSGHTKLPPEEEALKKRTADFSPELAKALQADLDANARAGEVVGLDYDPFLNAQDPCQKYVVGGKTSEDHGVWKVEVFGVCDGKKEAKASVIAVVKARASHSWFFTNFEDPEDKTDLLQNLRALAKERAH
ncbi:MAG: DUF3828 domain-containing protein [Chthoniobacteraceae bacterium]